MSANLPKRRRGQSLSTQDLQNAEQQTHDQIQSPSRTNPDRRRGHAEASMSGQQNSEGKMLLLPLPRRIASMSRTSDKNRTTHACDLCRKAKAKCTGGQPCQKCKNEGKNCFYGDGKRDKERKILERTSRQYEALRNHAETLRSNVRKVVEHSNLSELEQEEISELLDKSPPFLSDDDEESVGSQYRVPHSPYLHKQSGEFNANGGDVGSTGSLDAVAVDTNRDEETRATGFLGKSSSVRWIQRAEQEVHGPSSMDQMKSEPALYQTGDPDLCEPVEQGDHVSWKYELPEIDIATKLVDTYFDHVHQDFPILSKPSFLQRFHYYTNNRGKIFNEKDHMALCQINCVFAISSTFALLMAENVDPRGHLVYYARTRALGLEEQPTNAQTSLDYVCSLGLLGLYLVSNHFINRAWVTVGLAVRNAQTFGLHVRNKASGPSDSEKEHRNRMWWSIFSLEHLMNEVTGRPSCISQGDMSAPHPVGRDPKTMIPPERQAGSSTSRPKPKRLKSGDIRGKGKGSEFQKVKESQESGSLNASLSTVNASDSYFSHRITVMVLTHEILNRLFCASTVHTMWNEVQDTIRDIDGRLQTWKSLLPDELKFPSREKEKEDEHESQRKGLEVLYYTARMILHRPVLCRMDDRIKNESSTSQKFNHDAVTSCVESARALLATLGKPGDPTKLYLIRPWWEILHHLCQAAGILMLEIAFSACHFREQASEILQDAKDAVHWLRAMSRQSIAARKAWRVNDRTLRLVGTKINADMSDMLHEADFPPGWDSVPASMQRAPFNEENVSSLEPSSYQETEGYQTGRLAATTAWANSFPQSEAAFSPELYQPSFSGEPSFQPGIFQGEFSQGFTIPYSAFDEGGFPMYDDEALFGNPSPEMMQALINPSLESYQPYSGNLEPSGVDMGSQNLEDGSHAPQNMAMNMGQNYRDFENSFRRNSNYGNRQRPSEGN